MKKLKIIPLKFLANESVNNRHAISFEIRGPNEETLKAMKAIKEKEYSKPYDTAEKMFADLDKQIAEE